MDHEEAFLRALRENEDDTEARLVYADWLEDEGRHEEADRQRKWPAAKQALLELVDYYNEYVAASAERWADIGGMVGNRELTRRVIGEDSISYEMLMEIAESACDGRPTVGRLEDLRDFLDDHFWENWAIVTGRPIPYDVDGSPPFFTCAC